jgi:hypothetical protein
MIQELAHNSFIFMEYTVAILIISVGIVSLIILWKVFDSDIKEDD